MQRVFTVWDDSLNASRYDAVNDALGRGATVVSVSTSSAAESVAVSGMQAEVRGQIWAVTVFVLSGSAEQLGV